MRFDKEYFISRQSLDKFSWFSLSKNFCTSFRKLIISFTLISLWLDLTLTLDSLDVDVLCKLEMFLFALLKSLPELDLVLPSVFILPYLRILLYFSHPMTTNVLN